MASVGEEYGITLLCPVPQGFSGGCNQVLPTTGIWLGKDLFPSSLIWPQAECEQDGHLIEGLNSQLAVGLRLRWDPCHGVFLKMATCFVKDSKGGILLVRQTSKSFAI